MDISEPTISQESSGVSPECDNQPSAIIRSSSVDVLSTHDATTNASLTATTNATIIASDDAFNNQSNPTEQSLHTHVEPYDNANANTSLDNRPAATSINKTKTMDAKQRTDMTLVDMHPLMPARSSSSDVTPDSPIPSVNLSEQPADSGLDVEPIASASATLPPIERLLVSDEAKGPSPASESDEDDDVSKYEASVEPTHQSAKIVSVANSGLTAPWVKPIPADLRSQSSEETHSSNSTDGEVSNGDKSTFVTLSDGQTRIIDMKVIEPYKRCLSHGGYIQQPGNNAIVLFSACFLPDRSRTDYNYVMDNLFL